MTSTVTAPEAKREPASGTPSPGVLPAVVITALLTSFVAATYGFGFYLFAQLVTDMRAEMGFGFTAVGTITAGGQLGFLVFALAGAWLSHRVGGGWVIVGSVALCGTCLVLLPAAGNVVVVGLLLAILGGTAASVYVPMVEIVARVIAYRHRGKVLGLVSSGTSYGVFINSLLVPVFLSQDNWRGVWYSVGSGTLVITVIAVVVFWRLGLLRNGARHAETVPHAAPERTPWSIAFRSGAPWVLVIWAITFLNGFTTMPFQNYLAPYLREGEGLSVEFTSTVWGIIGFVGMFAGFLVGWLSDRTGVRAALLFCYSSIAVACALLVLAPAGIVPAIAGFCFAVAFYPIFGLVPAYVAKVAHGSLATVVFGVANVTLGIGGATGNYVAGVVKDHTGQFWPIYLGIAAATVLLGVLSKALPGEQSASPGRGRSHEEDDNAGRKL